MSALRYEVFLCGGRKHSRRLMAVEDPRHLRMVALPARVLLPLAHLWCLFRWHLCPTAGHARQVAKVRSIALVARRDDGLVLAVYRDRWLWNWHAIRAEAPGMDRPGEGQNERND